MIIGSTPTYTFSLPFTVDNIAEAKVIFSQGDVSVSKKFKDCGASGNTLTVRLCQEDTLRFRCGLVEIQIKVLTPKEDVLVSDVMYDNAEKCIDKEVLVCE
jgi:hypothetical protein